MLAPGVNVRDTADCETPARRATSIDDGGLAFAMDSDPPSPITLINEAGAGYARLHSYANHVAMLCISPSSPGFPLQATDLSSLPDISRGQSRVPSVGLLFLALAMGGFAIGTTEFASMSLLPYFSVGLG